MKSYFLRRLLLIPPTLVGITLLVFTITRFVPGGPMDRMLQEAARGADQGGKRSSGSQAQGGLSEEQLEDAAEKDKYAAFWKDFDSVLKEGIGEDHANQERLTKLLRFAST